MTKFAVIDEHSGYVWGVTKAADAIEACRILDADAGEHGRTYTDIGRGARFDGRSGYHVYRAPDDFTIDDGQDEDQIASVEGLPLETRVVTAALVSE
jgi:hypothetical protein